MSTDGTRMRLRGHLTAYFQALRHERDLSPNTVASYKDTWRLLVDFGANRYGLAASGDWRVGQVDREFALSFLSHLERDRGCAAVTRNARLAALQSFFRWLRDVCPPLRDHCGRILSIRKKRIQHPVVGYLEGPELRIVLDAVDLSRVDGVRDLALLCLAYNTAARVHELAGLRKDHLILNSRPSVRIWGKGRKQRELPLWDVTAQVLRLYLERHRRTPRLPISEPYFFIGQKGRHMTRFGVAEVIERAIARASRTCGSLRSKRLTAHSMRHTTAVHLLQSGADLVTIQNWLGHASVNTVTTYLQLDLEAKRNVLEHCLPPDYVASRLENEGQPPTADPDSPDWLQDL